jgi:hypothetical protein
MTVYVGLRGRETSVVSTVHVCHLNIYKAANLLRVPQIGKIRIHIIKKYNITSDDCCLWSREEKNDHLTNSTERSHS